MVASTVPVHKDGLVITANQVSLRCLLCKENAKDQETIKSSFLFSEKFKDTFLQIKASV